MLFFNLLQIILSIILVVKLFKVNGILCERIEVNKRMIAFYVEKKDIDTSIKDQWSELQSSIVAGVIFCCLIFFLNIFIIFVCLMRVKRAFYDKFYFTSIRPIKTVLFLFGLVNVLLIIALYLIYNFYIDSFKNMDKCFGTIFISAVLVFIIFFILNAYKTLQNSNK